tara:strand:- start:656 stop:1147 length:492 start_codon:yes stop_codon:yes gene_type:complete
MWIIAKIKNKEFYFLKNALNNKLGSEAELYGPKILVDKLVKNKFQKKKKFILENYIFLKHEKFLDKSILNSIRYLKGIELILPFFNSSQKEIINFVKKCKENENKFGYLTQEFFTLVENKKIEFSSGPFLRFVGELIDIQKKKIKVLVKNHIVSFNSEKTIVF